MNDLFQWVSPQTVASFTLIVARMSGLFLIAPLFGNKAVPPQVRVALVIITSLTLFPFIPKTQALEFIHSDLAVIAFIIKEVTIGLIVGFSAYLVFAAIQTAGEIIGLQLGFGIATIFDPANEGAAGILTTLYTILGAVIFLNLDGHHILLAGLVRSFDLVHLGADYSMIGLTSIVEVISKTFAIAIQIAIPVLVCTTILNFIFGFITKISPQMNIYFNVAFIITPVVGIIIVMTSFPLFRILLTQMTENLEPEMIRVLLGLKGA